MFQRSASDEAVTSGAMGKLVQGYVRSLGSSAICVASKSDADSRRFLLQECRHRCVTKRGSSPCAENKMCFFSDKVLLGNFSSSFLY